MVATNNFTASRIRKAYRMFLCGALAAFVAFFATAPAHATGAADAQVEVVFGIPPWPGTLPPGDVYVVNFFECPSTGHIYQDDVNCISSWATVSGALYLRADLGLDSTGSIPPSGLIFDKLAGGAEFFRCEGENFIHPECFLLWVRHPPLNLHVISPFLLGAKDLTNIDLQTLLANIKQNNWWTVTANGLVADNTSVAIALWQTKTRSDVTFTTNNDTSLLPYTNSFLNPKPPLEVGSPTLTVRASQLKKIGTLFYAAALLQAPAVGAAPAFDKPITVTAQQGTVTQGIALPLVPPPVVLVHGIWGDKTSLENVRSYLTSIAPWQNHPELVQPICYSLYLAFDAKTDPLTTGSDPCEVTSKVALQTEINPLVAQLDMQHIVGGRVDVVAHSMGGLVARHYSAVTGYKDLRNRNQGAFHEVVTIDTPELGSNLATYLYNNANDPLEATLLSNPVAYGLWKLFCTSTDTVRTCFGKMGMPLAGDSLPLNKGAVYSLEPATPAVCAAPNPPSLCATPSPQIPNVTWRAVEAIYPGSTKPTSLLRNVLDTLIEAICPSSRPEALCPPKTAPPTTTQILRSVLNDVVVTAKSQINNGNGNFYLMPVALAHTEVPYSAKIEKYFGTKAGVDRNVENSSAVNQLVGCWLATGGDTSCPNATQMGRTQEVAFTNSTAQPWTFKVSVA